jgi:hypothetical protein
MSLRKKGCDMSVNLYVGSDTNIARGRFFTPHPGEKKMNRI